MSVCRDCGANVVWAKREDGRPHPPLTPVDPDWDPGVDGLLLAVVDGVVRTVQSQLFVRHACLPEDKVLWEQKLAAAEIHHDAFSTAERHQAREQAILKSELEQRTAAWWKLAIPRPCPKCGAEPGDSCKNLSDRRYGKPERDTRLPHEARMPGGVYPQTWPGDE